jgi:osmoprotectant transport system permease protein
VFDALAAGEIDVYPEYTGTITAEILAGQNVTDEKTMHEVLRQKGIGVSKSLGFSDTYALALTRKRAAQLGISRISDLKRLPELQLALTHEFLDRGDGWPALKRRYDLQQRNVVGVDHDVAYRQLLAGEVDIIDVYSTDAMIRRGDLVLLTDDSKFFPRYDAVWLYRLDTAKREPELVAAMHRLEGTVSEATMQSLNDEVEAGRKTETQAAADFLSQQVGLHVAVQTTSRTEMIMRHILEHLDLVRRSLFPAIVVGVALGILCQRRPRIGRVVLASVGLLQTIPSLALLVLLLPLVAALGYRSIGEGSVTAVTALFCYCLLPIVRNTYTGIDGIQRGTIESATVLGLGPMARLVEIELPIALPTLLAGIRTSAVQNVGFATLGAIIGAGGLGQPILRGIRVNDISLILAGAIPAALLALLLQGSIDAIEWAVVPRGLKRREAVQE